MIRSGRALKMGVTASARVRVSPTDSTEFRILISGRKTQLVSIPVTLLIFALSFAVACGSAEVETSDEAPAASVSEDEVATIGDRPELRAFTRPSGMFSVDDFVDAGWKKNKEYDLDTLPEAEGAFFGFYNRKDIELRFYPSHDVAMGAGKDSAETAIKTEKLSGRGAGFSSVTLYGAYLVAGNVVMLCELSVTDCTDLLDQMAQ